MKKVSFITVIIYILLLVGEVKCVVKAFQCNWDPIGKAEILYTASACCGFGCIVGWIDIKHK